MVCEFFDLEVWPVGHLLLVANPEDKLIKKYFTICDGRYNFKKGPLFLKRTPDLRADIATIRNKYPTQVKMCWMIKVR